MRNYFQSMRRLVAKAPAARPATSTTIAPTTAGTVATYDATKETSTNRNAASKQKSASSAHAGCSLAAAALSCAAASNASLSRGDLRISEQGAQNHEDNANASKDSLYYLHKQLLLAKQATQNLLTSLEPSRGTSAAIFLHLELVQFFLELAHAGAKLLVFALTLLRTLFISRMRTTPAKLMPLVGKLVDKLQTLDVGTRVQTRIATPNAAGSPNPWTRRHAASEGACL